MLWSRCDEYCTAPLVRLLVWCYLVFSRSFCQVLLRRPVRVVLVPEPGKDPECCVRGLGSGCRRLAVGLRKDPGFGWTLPPHLFGESSAILVTHREGVSRMAFSELRLDSYKPAIRTLHWPSLHTAHYHLRTCQAASGLSVYPTHRYQPPPLESPPLLLGHVIRTEPQSLGKRASRLINNPKRPTLPDSPNSEYKRTGRVFGSHSIHTSLFTPSRLPAAQTSNARNSRS